MFGLGFQQIPPITQHALPKSQLHTSSLELISVHVQVLQTTRVHKAELDLANRHLIRGKSNGTRNWRGEGRAGAVTHGRSNHSTLVVRINPAGAVIAKTAVHEVDGVLSRGLRREGLLDGRIAGAGGRGVNADDHPATGAHARGCAGVDAVDDFDSATVWGLGPRRNVAGCDVALEVGVEDGLGCDGGCCLGFYSCHHLGGGDLDDGALEGMSVSGWVVACVVDLTVLFRVVMVTNSVLGNQGLGGRLDDGHGGRGR